MAKLMKIQKMLKDLGIKFDYKENYQGGVIAEITFKDSLGKDYVISNYSNSTSLHHSGYGDMDNQNEACEWIQRNKTLLTDKEASLKIEKEKEEKKKLAEEMRKVVESWEFEKEGYTIKIEKRKNGYMQYQLKNNRRKESDFIPDIYINNYNHDENVFVKIQTTSYGALNQEQAKEFMIEFEKGMKTIEFFNSVLDEIVNKK